jgi:hypothetical protein
VALSKEARSNIASVVGKRRAFELRKRYNEAMAQEPFENWMKSYARWLAERPEAPSMDRRRARASQCAKTKLQNKAVRALEARDDFQAYYREVREGGIRAARHKFETTLPEATDTLEWALSEAKKSGDYKAVLGYADRILDRVFPKKSEDNGPVAAVQIVLQTRQATYLDEQLPEVTVEEVVVEDGD